MEERSVLHRDNGVIRLTTRLAAADQEAFREFHGQYFDRLYHFLLVVCRGSDDQAQEALQRVLLRVVRHARVFHDEETFWCWLKALARTAACDAQRRHRRYAALLDRFSRWWRLHDPQAVHEPDPLEGKVGELLAELDPTERRLVEGKYLAGESVRELAASTGLSEKAVESRLSRLRQRLRSRFLELLNHDEPS